MREVPVGIHGHVALVDDGDYALVSPYRWSLFRDRDKRTREIRRVYAYRKWWELCEDGQQHCRGQFMHVLIMGQRGVDHADHDGLNNQRSNLRVASSQENCRNRLKHREAASQFKGVTPEGRKWRAQICTPERPTNQYLGTFGTEEDAARAYDSAALAHFGEFANLNFPEEVRSFPAGAVSNRA